MKITYLLGAGASFNALPLIKRHSIEKPGLSEDLMKFVNSNKYLINHNNAHGVFESLIKIVKQCIQFGTPDLYSKLLLETGDDSTYEILKRLLSLYFQHKQTVDECFDERALAFLTTIVTGKKLPETIRILTWNYDSQIEIAAEKLKQKGKSC